MNKSFVLLIIAPLFWGCLPQKSTTGRQGITGEVRWVEGNLMPSMGDPNYIERTEGAPVEREVYIYEAAKLEDVVPLGGSFYKSISTELVKKIRSEKDGSFRTSLPPGKYSIFVLEKEGFFANIFDGENFINPVMVEENKYTNIDIKINYKAYY